MAKRKALTKKTRFEVFKRDSFTCQYCGKAAPDAVLQVDHIRPVSKGGDNEIVNLVTSCRSCNAGKSDRELSDDAAIQKQRAQLEELNERREQLEMMLEWREGIRSIKDDYVRAVIDAFEIGLDHQWKVNEHGERNARRWVNKFDLTEILEAIDISIDRYVRYNGDELNSDSANKAFTKVPGIIYNRRRPEDERELFYIRGIIRNRMYCNERYCMQLLRKANELGCSNAKLKQMVFDAKNWTEWRSEMENMIDAMEVDGA